jgi:peroxiredoxin
MLRTRSRHAAAFACSLSLLVACGGPHGVGSYPPTIRPDKITHAGFDQLSENRGKLVMYEYFAYWCPPCAMSTPHVNALIDAYGKRGLVVVGVTGEPEDATEQFVQTTGARFAVAYEPGLESMRAFGFKGFPSAALVGKGGKIVWKGHPMALDAKVIEQNLARPD